MRNTGRGLDMQVMLQENGNSVQFCPIWVFFFLHLKVDPSLHSVVHYYACFYFHSCPSKQMQAKHSLWLTSSPPLPHFFFINKVLLGHAGAHSLTYYLWPFSCKSRVAYGGQRLYRHENVKYLLSASLQKKFVDFCIKLAKAS